MNFEKIYSTFEMWEECYFLITKTFDKWLIYVDSHRFAKYRSVFIPLDITEKRWQCYPLYYLFMVAW